MEKSTRTTDKRMAERLANQWEADAMLRREGVIDADLDEYAREARRPIVEHVAAYKKHLESRRSDSHVGQTIKRVERMLEKGKIGNWHDVRPDVVERALAKIVADDEIGAKTRNYYLTAFKSFANWMVKQKRASHNPVEAVERLDVESSEHRRLPHHLCDVAGAGWRTFKHHLPYHRPRQRKGASEELSAVHCRQGTEGDRSHAGLHAGADEA